MKINSINQNVNQRPSFGIKVSPKLKTILEKQATEYPHSKQLTEELCKKIQNMKNLGNPTSELTIAKNRNGNYSIGIRKIVGQHSTALWPIEHINAKTDFSKFMHLTERHIVDTENTIDYIYKKYGGNVFKRFEI